MIDAPWIVANDANGPDPYMLQCLRCGARQRFALPVTVDYFVAAVKAFQRKHEICLEPAAGPVGQCLH
jgi:hypothetical protein